MATSKGPIRRAVDESIAARVDDGAIDARRNAAPIAMLRKMADFLDADDRDTPAYRYVSPASFLSYCDALGLMPGKDAAKGVASDDDARGGRLAAMRGRLGGAA